MEPGIHVQKLVEFNFFGEANKDGMMGPESRKDCLQGFIYLDKKRHVNYQGGNNTKHQAQDPIGYRWWTNIYIHLQNCHHVRTYSL